MTLFEITQYYFRVGKIKKSAKASESSWGRSFFTQMRKLLLEFLVSKNIIVENTVPISVHQVGIKVIGNDMKKSADGLFVDTPAHDWKAIRPKDKVCVCKYDAIQSIPLSAQSVLSVMKSSEWKQWLPEVPCESRSCQYPYILTYCLSASTPPISTVRPVKINNISNNSSGHSHSLGSAILTSENVLAQASDITKTGANYSQSDISLSDITSLKRRWDNY